jgi:TPR repeat protein
MEKGIKYLQRAKDLKYPKAFLNLGKCYENGIGISLSIDMARACYL